MKLQSPDFFVATTYDVPSKSSFGNMSESSQPHHQPGLFSTKIANAQATLSSNVTNYNTIIKQRPFSRRLPS